MCVNTRGTYKNYLRGNRVRFVDARYWTRKWSLNSTSRYGAVHVGAFVALIEFATRTDGILS